MSLEIAFSGTFMITERVILHGDSLDILNVFFEKFDILLRNSILAKKTSEIESIAYIGCLDGIINLLS